MYVLLPLFSNSLFTFIVRYRAIVLFDTCDLWIGEHTATELKTSLGECMKEGDHVKVRALLVPESENSKMIR